MFLLYPLFGFENICSMFTLLGENIQVHCPNVMRGKRLDKIGEVM